MPARQDIKINIRYLRSIDIYIWTNNNWDNAQKYNAIAMQRRSISPFHLIQIKSGDWSWALPSYFNLFYRLV